MNRLGMCENLVLRKISGPKWDWDQGDWRKLHSEELRDYCSSPDNIREIGLRRMRWAGHMARNGQRTATYRAWYGILRETSFEVPRRRWEDNIKIYLKD
jgi:hypothetical protein